MGIFNLLRDGYHFAASSMLGLLAPSFTSRQEDMPGRYTQVLETGVPALAMPTTPPRDHSAGSARSTLLWAWDGLKGATRLIGDAFAATSNAISTSTGLSVASMDEEPLPSDEDYEFIEDPDAEEMDRLNDCFLPSVLNMPGYRRVADVGCEEYSGRRRRGWTKSVETVVIPEDGRGWDSVQGAPPKL